MENPNKTLWHENFQQFINKTGLTERELAKIAGCKQPYINKLSNGQCRQKAIQVFIAICDHFQISMDSLLRGISTREDEQKNELQIEIQILRHGRSYQFFSCRGQEIFSRNVEKLPNER